MDTANNTQTVTTNKANRLVKVCVALIATQRVTIPAID